MNISLNCPERGTFTFAFLTDSQAVPTQYNIFNTLVGKAKEFVQTLRLYSTLVTLLTVVDNQNNGMVSTTKQLI